jgi:hypothetical protein
MAQVQNGQKIDDFYTYIYIFPVQSQRLKKKSRMCNYIESKISISMRSFCLLENKNLTKQWIKGAKSEVGSHERKKAGA